MKNMVYIQSGGPTSVINTSLYGAIQEGKRHPDQISGIYGSQHGVEGLINDDLINLGLEDDEQIELLLQTSGSILGTSRKKLPKDVHDPIYLQIIETLKKHNIGYVFVNGGNDSMDTCHKLSILVKELGLDIKVIGVPKTIDNDLACTDHSLGFPSAAKYVINTLASIVMDAKCFNNGKVHVVEIMGRTAGWLSGCGDILDEELRPDLFYLPENPFDAEQFLKDVKEIYEKKGYVVVAASEGTRFERDMSNAHVDGFGHVSLEGTGAALCDLIKEKLGLPTRAIELSLMQRATPVYISLVDRQEAILTGETAVKAALAGETGKMITFKRVSDNPYKIELELGDLSKVANAVSLVPQSMMVDKTRMSDSFRNYIAPLIKGDVTIKFKDGIAEVTRLKRIPVKN